MKAYFKTDAMLNTNRIRFYKLLAIGFFVLSNSKNLCAQYAAYTSPIVGDIVLDIRSQSLGNSFVSFLGKEGAQEVNPASIGNNQDLRFTFTKREWKLDTFYTDPFKFYQYGVQTGFKNWGFAYQTRYFDFSEDSFNPESKEYYHNVSASYNNQRGFSFGLGLNYIKSDLGSTTSVSGVQEAEANALSVDVGMQYQKTINKKNLWQFTPSVGLSISDFGTMVKYNEQSDSDPLPMRLRTGVGMSVDLNKRVKEFQIFKTNLALATSKILFALESDENGNVRRFGPFQTLIKTWGSIDFPDLNTGQVTSYTLGEQFIFHSGLEVVFLESFSFRLGYQNGQELNDYYSIKSYGFGIDLYYIAVDYVHSEQFAEAYNRFDTPINGEYLQVTGRIPLDGKSPKSLLRLLF